MVGDGRGTCPLSLRWKTRPRSRAVGHFPKEQLDDFILRPVMDVLDAVEFDSASVSEALSAVRQRGASVHPGVDRFADHAVSTLLGSALSGDRVQMRPVREFWVAQRVLPTVVWELYSWGRRYESSDGRMREFWFLRLADARERDPVEIAIAAYAAAFGYPAAWPRPWSEPFRPSGHGAVERVRILDIGLADGSARSLFEGDLAQVEDYFAEHGRPRIVEIGHGEDMVPGFGCANCKRVTVCRGPKRLPGLLGVGSGRGSLRTISVSGLRYYRNCPAQAYLRAVHLPSSYEYSAEAELGQAVHAWLESRHRDPGGGCQPGMALPSSAGWQAGKWRVTGAFAESGVKMLTHHVNVCPFRNDLEIDEVRVEPQLTFIDTVARAVVVAKPDLIYRECGRWVWREVKTTQKSRSFYDDPLLEFPQLALGVLVLSMGGLGPGDVGRVELEVLRPDGAEIVLIDPTDEVRVAVARRVLRELAAPWRSDDRFEARPGRSCRSCPVSVWCPSYPGVGPNEGDVEAGAGSRTTVED